MDGHFRFKHFSQKKKHKSAVKYKHLYSSFLVGKQYKTAFMYSCSRKGT